MVTRFSSPSGSTRRPWRRWVGGGALAAVLLGVGLAGPAGVMAARPASAATPPASTVGAAVVRVAQSYPLGSHGGQCKVWAQAVANAAFAQIGWPGQIGGYGTPAGADYGADANAGGHLVGVNDAQPGDIVQLVPAAQKNLDYPTDSTLHTAIVVARTGTAGTYTVRDSNSGRRGPENVDEHPYIPATDAVGRGADVYVWRFGADVPTVPDPAPSWVQHPGQAQRIAVTRGPNAAHPWTAFHIGLDNAIYRQTMGDAGWTKMAGTSAREVAAFTNPDGRAEVFQIGTNGVVYHSWQSTAGGAFSGWVSRGGAGWRALAATRSGRGGWQLFAVGADRAVYRMAPWDGVPDWQKLAGTAEQDRVAAFTNADGRIEMMLRNIHNTLYLGWQSAVGSGFGTWAQLPGSGLDVAIVENGAKRGWDMYTVGTDRRLWVRSLNGDQNWRAFAGVTADHVTAETNADGRTEVWHLNAQSHGMYHAWQNQPGAW